MSPSAQVVSDIGVVAKRNVIKIKRLPEVLMFVLTSRRMAYPGINP